MSNKPKTALDYYSGENKVPEGAFRIGASSFNSFISRPWQFYKEQVLGIGGFEGSTASVIGTCLHFACEQKAQGKEPDIKEINQYIENQSDNVDVDKYIVEKEWKQMAMCAVNEFVLPNKHRYSTIEEFITYKLTDGLYIGGSIDATLDVQWIDHTDHSKGSTSGTILDYKSTSGRVPTSIPANYKQQLLVYAWVLKQLGRTMDRIQLVYITREKDTRAISEKTGKPIGKLIPPTCTVLVEQITSDDLKFIEDMIMLCKDKLLTTEKYPELRNLIWHFPNSYIEK